VAAAWAAVAVPSAADVRQEAPSAAGVRQVAAEDDNIIKRLSNMSEGAGYCALAILVSNQ
jgi:hypothetical protein